MYFAFSTWAKSRTKFNPQIQDFECVFGVDLLVKGRLNNLIFSIGFQILKI